MGKAVKYTTKVILGVISCTVGNLLSKRSLASPRCSGHVVPCFQYIASCCSRGMEDKGIFLALKDVSVAWKFICTVGVFFALSDKVKWLTSVNSEIEDICWTK